MGALIGGPLLKKVYFPPECPAIANVLTVLIQTGIEADPRRRHDRGRQRSWTFLLFPYILVLLMLFSLGIGMVLSLLNVYLRDVNYLVGIAMNLLFYGTPIVYPYTLVEENAPVGRDPRDDQPADPVRGRLPRRLLPVAGALGGRIMGLTAVSFVTFAAGWPSSSPSRRT